MLKRTIVWYVGFLLSTLKFIHDTVRFTAYLVLAKPQIRASVSAVKLRFGLCNKLLHLLWRGSCEHHRIEFQSNMLLKVSQHVTVFASSVNRLFFFFFAFCTCSCREPLLHTIDLEDIRIFMAFLPFFHISHSILKHQVSEYPLRPGHVNQVEHFFPYEAESSIKGWWMCAFSTFRKHVILHSAYTMNIRDDTLVYCPFTSTWC